MGVTATTVAWGGRTKRRPEPEPAVDLEEHCPTTPPTGFRVWRGDASSPDQGAAMAAAREEARRKARSDACKGLSELRCAAIQRNIRDWKQGYWSPSTGAACASVALKATWLDTFQTDVARFERGLAQLCEHVGGRVESGLVRLEPPTWESGCVAGEVGAAVSVAMRNQLARNADLQLVAPETETPATALRVQLAPTSDGVILSADLQDPGDVGVTPLEGFRFPLDLFDVDSNEAGQCRSDDALGIEGGQRVGTDGLRVWITVPTTTGVYCEGNRVEPVLAVNRPARVQVYNVARDGLAYLVWPPPSGSDLVESTASLGEMHLVSLPDVGDERMVAIAIPAGERFGSTRGWSAYCKVPGDFGPDRYPDGAALGTATFTVELAGTGDCPPVPGIERLKEQMPTFPACGVP